MNLSQGDKNVVYNIRYKHGEKVRQYSDEHIAKVWRLFSGSEDYPNEEAFLEWLTMD